jgi:hypothetical protein
MAASSFVLLLSLAMVGVGEGVARVHSLTGVVVGPEGEAVAGAEVIAASSGRDGQSPTLLGRTRSDEAGKFEIKLVDEPSACDRPILWAIDEDRVVGSRPIDPGSINGEPIRISVGSPGGTDFIVAGPDGQPILGAKIIPRSVARDSSKVPDAVAELVAATTDHEGRAELDGFRPEELLSVAVEVPGFGVQIREFRNNDGLADVGTRSITLQPCGRVVGRVVADDPKAVAGLSVHVESAGVRGGMSAGVAEVSTDQGGHFEVPAIASGALTVRVRPRQGASELPSRVIRRNLESGRALEIEIPLRRGVRVTGVALSARDSRPISGVVVSVVPSGIAEPLRVRTDEQGHYEAFVPAGLVSHRVLEVPSPYLCPPSFLGPRPVEVPPAIARFELPPIRLERGEELRGKVVDAHNQAVSGARVEASWTMTEGRIRAPRSEATTSKADGSFVLLSVPADSELIVIALIDEARAIEPVKARTSDPKPIVLRISEPEGNPADGLVVSPDGQPIAGASVRIWALSLTPAGAIESTRIVRFDDSDEILTDADGRFETPRPLRRDRIYRAFASAEGFQAAQTRAIRTVEAGPTSFPDLVLVGDCRRVEVLGQVLDRSGRPIEGVAVRTSSEGPCSRRGTTGLDGRFRIDDVPQGPIFLFAEKDGFRFLGLSISAGAAPVSLTLTRLDEPSTVSMTTRKIPSAGLGLARRVLAPYAERVLTEGDQSTRTRALELLARVDPNRVLQLVKNPQVVDPWLADHLRHAASCSPATEPMAERLTVVESIQDAEWRVIGQLDAADALPETSRSLKRERVEQALGDARSIGDPARRVVALAKVADRLIDLGHLDRATQLLEETRPIAEGLPPATSGGRARVEFALAFARVDPKAALALTEGLVDPGAFDRCRVEIARSLAARSPSEAAKVLESLRDPRSIERALPALCQALAPVDPAQARRLLARSRTEEPCLAPYALGLMALAIADQDKPTATSWLREAFDRLGQVVSGSVGPGCSRDPAAVASALLPVAERIDPTLVPEFFWKAVSFHSPRTGSEIRSDAVLALLLARYNGEVARVFLDPLADRAITSNEADLAPLIATLAVLDPFRAVRLIEELPEAPDLSFHRPKNEARLALAAALVQKTSACWDDAIARFLNLTAEASRNQK